MRLGRYLKVPRLIRQCAVTNEACNTGRVVINDKVVRVSYKIKEGDVLELQLGVHSLKMRVVRVNRYTPRGGASEMYEAVS